MQGFLDSVTASPVDPVTILVRLLMAAALGWLVSWIYRRTLGASGADGLPTTLVMLAILIAMVTQVIGDNVARAFSLVGALSIVRFRTVVRDTRDTAFVIFAVVVGMSTGASNLWVALVGLAVGGGAAFALSATSTSKVASTPVFLLRVRGRAGVDMESLLAGKTFRLMGVDSGKQGTLLETTYEVHLQEKEAAALLKAVTETAGVQEVRLQRAGETE